MVVSAQGRITPHTALPYEELDLSYENKQKLLPPELHSLTPLCTKSFVG